MSLFANIHPASLELPISPKPESKEHRSSRFHPAAITTPNIVIPRKARLEERIFYYQKYREAADIYTDIGDVKSALKYNFAAACLGVRTVGYSLDRTTHFVKTVEEFLAIPKEAIVQYLAMLE